jgi:hypothetical protein
VDIVKNDWVREVTEASNSCVVLVHLYENSTVECEVLDEAMRQLAPRFKYLKFLRIKSTHAIENWPERNLPALFIYEDGVMKTQIITLRPLDGKGTKAEGNALHSSDVYCRWLLFHNSTLLTLNRFGVVPGREGHNHRLRAGGGPQAESQQYCAQAHNERRHGVPHCSARLGRRRRRYVGSGGRATS